MLAIGRPGAGPLQLSGSFGAGVAEVVVDLSAASSLSAEERWPSFHPGPLDPTSGWRGHRAAVVFDVPAQVSAQAWVLRLTFAASHGPCPDLLVDLDGHTGLLRPRVVRQDRAEVFRQSPIAGSVDLGVVLPGAWLAPGRHRLTITTALDGSPDGPPGHERRRPREQYDTWFGSGISWDSLSITAAPASALPQRPAVSLTSTPLVARTAEGPRQLLDLVVDLVPGGEHDPVAVVEIGGERHDVALPADGRSFGQAWARFGVPELAQPAGPTTAGVVRAGERTSHQITAPRRWTVHLVPHVHLDVGFTDHQADVLELHSRNLDRSHAVMEAGAAAGAGRGEAFRLSVDGAVVVRDHLATRRTPVGERTLDALRSGQVSVNAFHSLFLSGVASLEECYRETYLSAGLREQHGVPVTYANLTDVPSYSAALPGILRDLGLDGFVGLANHGRAATADSDEVHLRSPFVWEGLDGQGVLAHVADSYSQLRFMAGDPQTLPGAAQALERYLGRYEREDHLPSDIAVVGTHADNEDLADGDTSLVPRWNAAYAWPRMVVSTLADYLDVVRPLRDRLPVRRGDGGSFWEDGVGTAATAIALYRRAQTLLPVAEGLGALVGVASGAWRPDRATLDAGWDALLIGCEHTWTWSHAASHPGAHQAHDQLAWKRHRIESAWRTGTDETRRAMSQLGELVATTGPSLLVHNPLSWARGVEVEVEVPRGVRPTLGGVEVSCEVLADVDGLDRLRLGVPDVPAFGWRTLGLPAAGPGPAGEPSPDLGWEPLPQTLHAGRWEVGTDPSTGMVRRLVHVPSGRSLLDEGSPWPLGTVLHAAHVPTGGPDSLQDRRPPAPEPVLDVEPATMRSVGARRTHDGWRLRWEGAGRTMPQVVLEVLLREGSDAVDVSVHLEKGASLAKEGIYVAFPFAAQDPTVRYDRQQGWVDPAVDHSPGACNEWFTTQHGVVVSSGVDGPAVAWSSREVPLFTVGDVVRGRWPETFTAASGTVLSWVMNNYWTTNTPPSQEGPLDLRWSFAPMERFDAAAAARLGRELRWPAVSGEVTWWDKFDTDPRPLPPTGSLYDLGLCEADAQAVHVTVAQTRDGQALVVRLAELAGREQRLGLRHPSGAGGVAHLAWADDRPREPLPVGDDATMPVTLRPWSVVTLRLEV